MGSRLFRIFFIAFQVVWLNAIVPGHTRGALAIGGACAGESGKSCCHTESAGGRKSPTPEQKARCAICFFAARMSTPPVIDFGLDRLGVLTLLDVPEPQSAPAVATVSLPAARGPPAC